jgi:hypothetical protein
MLVSANHTAIDKMERSVHLTCCLAGLLQLL